MFSSDKVQKLMFCHWKNRSTADLVHYAVVSVEFASYVLFGVEKEAQWENVDDEFDEESDMDGSDTASGDIGNVPSVNEIREGEQRISGCNTFRRCQST